MTGTAIFSFARADDDVVNIRTAVIDGDPWFVATDVCRALNLNLNKGASPHLLKLSDSERSTVQAATFGPQSNKGGRDGLRGLSGSGHGRGRRWKAPCRLNGRPSLSSAGRASRPLRDSPSGI